MSVPRHTPFDGSSKLFQIGLKPLDPADWIDVDERLPAYLMEKDGRWRERPDEVFAAEPDTGDAQRELREMLVAYLPVRFPDLYRRESEAMRIGPDRLVPLGGDEPPLLIAARLVEDDLVLMRRGESGWRLAAASMCFPSSWSLAE